MATVGSSVVREYAIDDGRGLHFRSEGQPDFKLEFRTGRVNVAWMQFKDDPSKHGAENAQNAEWAEKVLRYALGADASAKAIDSVNAKQSATFDHLGHKVSVMPSGMLNLVTIR